MKINRKSRLMWTALFLAVICLSVSRLPLAFGVGAQQTTPNNQRPRRVGVGEPPDMKNLGEPPEMKKKSVPSRTNDEVNEGDVVRVETQLVSVPAVVTDQTGRPLSGLGPQNFQIFEDGQLQQITNFGTTETPFEIALLLDTSGSTREDVALIRDAAGAFINSLRPGDRVGVVAFNTVTQGADKLATVDVLSELTNDRKSLKTAIDNLGSSNGTPYYDALQKVADTIFRDPPSEEMRGRRAVVALTDGVDSASESDFTTGKQKLLRAGIACYFIQVNTEDFVEDRLMKDCQDDGRLTLSRKQLERYRQLFVPTAKTEDYENFCQMGPFERMSISRELYTLARREMNDLAKSSGGRSVVAANLSDARAAFGRVAADLGTLYSIGYYPTNKLRDGRYRAIRLEVKGVKDKPQVRARDGYYAPKG